MLTQVTIRNFKRFDEVVIELGNPVVFIGPNNSGKTTALQALALWDLGLRRWNEKRLGKTPDQIVEEALRATLTPETAGARASLYDLSRDLCGSVTGGAPDLARHKTHLKGYGSWKRQSWMLVCSSV